MRLSTDGPAAWFWRVVIAFFFSLGLLFLVLGARLDPVALVAASALIAPAIFFGTVVVVRADQRL